jgi:ribosomal-protein-alanine N-acetyltransferase
MGSDTRPRAATLTGVVLRRAESSDLADVAALERTCYGDPWPASAFSALPDNSRVFFAVAREDGSDRLAGYVIGWYVMDEAELANLAVAPDSRGKGIGSALLDAMLDDAAHRGIAQVYLEVRESNQTARRLYASRFFSEVGRRNRYYRSPVEDALILRRTLHPSD